MLSAILHVDSNNCPSESLSEPRNSYLLSKPKEPWNGFQPGNNPISSSVPVGFPLLLQPLPQYAPLIIARSFAPARRTQSLCSITLKTLPQSFSGFLCPLIGQLRFQT